MGATAKTLAALKHCVWRWRRSAPRPPAYQAFIARHMEHPARATPSVDYPVQALGLSLLFSPSPDPAPPAPAWTDAATAAP